MAICDFRPDATNIPNSCMSKKEHGRGRKCLGIKESNVFNQPDRLSLSRDIMIKILFFLYERYEPSMPQRAPKENVASENLRFF